MEDGSAQKALSSSLPEVTIDTNNLMVAGESAGGYLTVSTALLDLTKLPIKVLFAQYPCLDIEKHIRTENVDELMLNCTAWADAVPYSEVEAVLAEFNKGEIRTRAPFASRMRMLQGMIQAGKFCDLEAHGHIVDPMQALERAGPLPPILLYQSKGDEAIPWQHTDAWAAKLKRLQPDVPLFLTYLEGDHVFDKNDTMATPWMEEPLEFVRKYWPVESVDA